ncbi:MAG TPA: RNA polymerase sigma factor [Thermoanaerobaculia bacterium]|jgi:RNA polymerase sigma-70 factor (ECF subfamily)|nr:RNA polymerase sigma factor [Thermoanaerobaculia bacterium]
MTDREGFKALYAKYYRRMVAFYIRAFRLSEEDAKDLAQDAFLRFYEALDEYRGDAEWAFLETVARRVAYNSIRSRSTAKRGGGQDMSLDEIPPRLEPAVKPPPDYADRETARFVRKRVREAIAELSQGQQQSIHLWGEGFKYKQIASILAISVDAVKSRLRDAKKHLHERLGEDVAGLNWPDGLPEEER